MLKISRTFSKILRIFHFDQFSRLFTSKNWRQRALKFMQIQINLQCITKDLIVAHLRFPTGFANKWPTVGRSVPISSTKRVACSLCSGDSWRLLETHGNFWGLMGNCRDSQVLLKNLREFSRDSQGLLETSRDSWLPKISLCGSNKTIVLYNWKVENILFWQKNDPTCNKFWLYQHRARKVPFWSYRQSKLPILKVYTLPYVPNWLWPSARHLKKWRSLFHKWPSL